MGRSACCGVPKGVDEEIIEGLRANFEGRMLRSRYVSGYGKELPTEKVIEIGLYWEKAAWEEAEHAAKFAELLGEVGYRLHQEEPGNES